jgi:hypothetical protein
MHKDGCIEILRPLKPHPELKDPRLKGKKRIRQNLWGNWNGYRGTKKVISFGTDGVAAKYWMEEP